jgi:hypothetical protein
MDSGNRAWKMLIQGRVETSKGLWEDRFDVSDNSLLKFLQLRAEGGLWFDGDTFDGWWVEQIVPRRFVNTGSQFMIYYKLI